MNKQYGMTQLQQMLELYRHITGELPKELRVTQDFFNWYRETLKEIAKDFGIAHTGIKDSDVRFHGVKLIARLDK